MTIFTTHDCHFTTFRRLLVAKEYVEKQLILLQAIAVESQLEMKYNQNSGCYDLSAMPFNFEMHQFDFIHMIEATKMFSNFFFISTLRFLY